MECLEHWYIFQIEVRKALNFKNILNSEPETCIFLVDAGLEQKSKLAYVHLSIYRKNANTKIEKIKTPMHNHICTEHVAF